MRLFIASALAFLVLHAYWGFDVYRKMNQEVIYRAETLMDERRAYIRALVETAVNGAQHQRMTVEARARHIIRERGRRALAMARHLWNTRPPGATDDDTAMVIREALRTSRFDHGRGYYYILNTETGICIMHATEPALEGRDLRELSDPDGRPIAQGLIDASKESREGYYAYEWSHPSRPGRRNRKIGYVLRFEPLNWAIVIGDYIEDITADVKAETLAQLEAMHFGDDGYIFAGTWEGLSLMPPVTGQNMLGVTDRNGVEIVRELIAAAKAGGGFVQYMRPDLGPGYRESERLSYVLPVPEWEWYVGAGISIDDINVTNASMKTAIRSEAMLNFAIGSMLVIVLAAASYVITLRSARRIGADIAGLETFLDQDGRHPDDLRPEGMHHAETHRLGLAIKGMAHRRDAAERALERESRNLEQSNAELERFAYVASHDLREPLRIVSSYAGLLRRRYREHLDADADTFIDFITDGARRMHDMIGDLLEYSRVKRADAPFEPVDLNVVCAQVITNLSARIAETGADIRVTDDLPTVKGRSPFLVSLMQNLLENAIKYVSPDRAPRVRIGMRVEGNEAIVSIADNGLGIDPAFHARIFLIFQRLHPAHTYPGTGVGLSICQSICESHGGRIWLESEVDVGTTFYFALQLADGSTAPGSSLV